MTSSTTAPSPAAQSRGPWLPKVIKYFGGSVIATVCSEVTFIAMYGVLASSTTWASVVGWLAGALPNYWLNRHWAWGRSGRPHLTREVLPYVTIVLVTLGLATALTGVSHRLLTQLGVGDSSRVAVVAIAFLGVYGLMFILRFLLFDRLFARLERIEAANAAEPEEAFVD